MIRIPTRYNLVQPWAQRHGLRQRWRYLIISASTPRTALPGSPRPDRRITRHSHHHHTAQLGEHQVIASPGVVATIRPHSSTITWSAHHPAALPPRGHAVRRGQGPPHNSATSPPGCQSPFKKGSDSLSVQFDSGGVTLAQRGEHGAGQVERDYTSDASPA
jgi:hypothetical protein